MRKLVLALAFVLVFASFASASTFTVSYSASGATECKNYCVYKIEPGYTVGLASSVASSISNSMSLTSQIDSREDEVYIVFTKTGTDVSAREGYLQDKKFATLVDPSFAYPIRSVSKILVGLSYNDVYINSSTLSRGIGPGLYSLVLRNKGQILSGVNAGKTQVTVDTT